MRSSDLPPDSLGAAAAEAAARSALAIDLQSPARHFGASVDLSDWLESGNFDSQRVALDWWQAPSLSPLGVQALDIEPSRRPIIAAAVAAAGARNLTAQLVVDTSTDSDESVASVRLRDVPIGSLPADCDVRYAGLLKYLCATERPIKVRARAVGTDRDGWNLVLMSQPTPYDSRTQFCAGPRSVDVVTSGIHSELVHVLVDGPAVPVLLGVAPDRDRITVVVGDQCIGELGSIASSEYLPLVRSALRRTVAPTCRGMATRSADGTVRFHVLLAAQPDALADICDPPHR